MLVWHSPATDSEVEHVFIGTNAEGAWVIYAMQYDSDPSGGNMTGQVTNTQTCAALDDLGDCGNTRPQSLCLACAGQVGVDHCVEGQ